MPIASDLPQDLLSHLHQFQSDIPKIVSKYQIYTVLPNKESFADQEIERLIGEGELFRVIANDKVTEWIIVTKDYLNFIQKQIELDDKLTEDEKDALIKYQQVIIQKTSTTHSISQEETLQTQYNLTSTQATFLLQKTYLESSAQAESQNSSLKPTICRIANIHKIISLSENYIKRSISLAKYKEIKLEELFSKWENSRGKFKDFKGIRLQFVLFWMIGKGILECFKSADGKKAVKLVG